MPPVAARRKPSNGAARFSGSKGKPVPGRVPAAPAGPGGAEKGKSEGEILFQDYFKSVGPRTYAAQVKRAGNGNHFLVLTEGKRDDATGEVRKIRLFQPSAPLAYDPLDFDPKNVRAMIDAGYAQSGIFTVV